MSRINRFIRLSTFSSESIGIPPICGGQPCTKEPRPARAFSIVSTHDSTKSSRQRAFAAAPDHIEHPLVRVEDVFKRKSVLPGFLTVLVRPAHIYNHTNYKQTHIQTTNYKHTRMQTTNYKHTKYKHTEYKHTNYTHTKYKRTN